MLFTRGNIEIPRYHGHARNLEHSSLTSLRNEARANFCDRFGAYFIGDSCRRGTRMQPKNREELIRDGVLTPQEWDRMDQIHGLR